MRANKLRLNPELVFVRFDSNLEGGITSFVVVVMTS